MRSPFPLLQRGEHSPEFLREHHVALQLKLALHESLLAVQLPRDHREEICVLHGDRAIRLAGLALA